jgi:integrase
MIVKRRCGMAGLEPDAFSAHGLRAGYLTEAARQGVALPEAMQQSQHRSVQQAASYYNDTERAQGRAARLAI